MKDREGLNEGESYVSHKSSRKKRKKKPWEYIMPKILDEINYDILNTVFSYIPNTAETSFFGMIESVEEFLNAKKKDIKIFYFLITEGKA